MQTRDGRLFVVWRHPRRAPFPIGELSYDGAKYRFRYDGDNLRLAQHAGFKAAQFALTRAFPDYDKSYESTQLFPAFASRLPDRRRPDYAHLLARFNLRPESHPFEILRETRGRLGTDDLGVEPELTLQGQLTLESQLNHELHVEGGLTPRGQLTLESQFSRKAQRGDRTASSIRATSFQCYVAGWQFHGGDGCLDQLAPGVQLRLERDQLNQHDPNAIVVLGPAGQKLGYVPMRYSGHVAWALSTGWHVVARLVELKPPPSPAAERARIIVEISGRLSVEEIRSKLRAKFRNPRFPMKLPDPPHGSELEGYETILIGPAPGKTCSACDQQIEATEELAIEYRYGDARGTHWFHEECQKIWNQMSRERAGVG
jgi:HIRAN domain